MKYPRVARWVVFRTDDQGNTFMENLLTRSAYRITDPVYWNLARKLDGKTNPFSITKELTGAEIRAFLETLAGYELIRWGRVLARGFGEIMVTAVEPQKIRGSGVTPFLLDTARLLLWLPALIGGWWCFWNHEFTEFGGAYWPGLIFGILVGVVLHELSHAVSALHWGGYVFEYGFFLKGFVLPGMYVLLQEYPVKRRLRRVLINSAGIEMNFLLSGLFLFLSTVMEGQAESLLAAGMGNLILALMNFLPGCGLDGEHMLGELLGSVSAVDRAREVLRNTRMRGKLKRRGASGKMELAACGILVMTKMILPMLLVLQIVEVIFLWFNG